VNLDPGRNQAIIDEALTAVSNEAPPARPIAVIAREGAPRGDDDATDDFRRAALQRGQMSLAASMKSPSTRKRR
jgi:hypothetical protein